MTSPSAERIERIAWDAAGSFGMVARRLQDGREIVAGEPDRLFQLASVFKVPILATLEARVLRGELSWQDRHTLTNETKSPGSGLLVDLDPGLSLSLEDLVTLMITLSDNTATDMCFAIAEQPRIAQQLEDWGIAPMSILMDCKTLLADVVGVPIEEIVRADPAGKQALMAGGPSVMSGAFTEDLTRTNLASARSMVDLLAGVAAGRLLPDTAAQHMLGIMGLEWYRHRIPARLPAGTRWGTKSGSLSHGVVNDTGVLQSDRGPIAFAMLAKDLADNERWERVIARTAQAAFEVLGQ
jgi:beta-lactamase class A